MEFGLAVLSGLGAFVALVVVVRFVCKRMRLAAELEVPLYLASLAAGFKVFTLFEGVAVPQLEKTFTFVLYLLGAIVVIRALGLLYFDIFLRTTRGVRLPPLIPKVIIWNAYALAGLLLFKTVWPNVEMTGILATSAVTSLVLGLALQPILGNFFAGVVISLEKPFRINDWIKYNDVEARVAQINWRTTHLRTRDNDNLVVPNRSIANAEIINYFYPHPLHMERLYVGVHYRTPPYRVKAALLHAVARVKDVLEKPSPAVFLVSFDDSAITYEVRIWIEDIAHKPRINSHVRSEIWEEFRRRGITIPFPIRTLEFEPMANTMRFARLRPPVEAEGGQPPGYRLVVARGKEYGKSLSVIDTETIVGRATSSTLRLSDPTASKQHFKITWDEEEGYVLEDLDSQHGTKVNGLAVERQVLAEFDRITIGDTVIVFEPHES